MTDEGADRQRFVLQETLKLAVPIHMLTMRDWSPDALTTAARAAADVVALHGDDLQFGGKHCAKAFNALARGLAAAALCAEGGVRWKALGLHWCTVPGCNNPDADHPNPYPERAADPTPQPRPIVDIHLPSGVTAPGSGRATGRRSRLKSGSGAGSNPARGTPDHSHPRTGEPA